MGNGIGARLRDLRKRAGLTQQALARRAGLSVSGVAGVERGKRPRPETVRALERALNVPAGTLAGTVAEKESPDANEGGGG